MKRLMIVVCFIMTIFFAVGPVSADKCKDPIVDEIQAFSDADRDAISKAMNKIVLRGADVRIQMLSSYHNTHSIDEYKSMFQAKCKSWQSSDGGMKNNLILLLVVPKKQATGIYIGEQWRRFLEAGKASIFTDMNGRFREGKLAEGILVGLKDVDNLMSVDLANAKKPVVINNNTPTDMSGLWHFFGWLLFFGILGGCIWFAIQILNRRAQCRAAQREAMTERANCTQAMNGYTTPLALLKSKIVIAAVEQKWKDYLTTKLAGVQHAFIAAAAALNGINRSANDPETSGLSVQEYKDMASRYRSVLTKFERAQKEMNELERNLSSALSGKSFTTSEEPYREPRADTPDRSFSSTDTDSVSPKSEKVHQPYPSGKQSSGGLSSDHHHRDPDNGVFRRGGDATVIVVNEEHHNVFDRPDWAEQRSHRDGPVIVEQDDSPKNHSHGDSISGSWGQSGDGDKASGSWGQSGDGDKVSGNWDDSEKTEPSQVSDDNSASSSLWEGSGTSY